MKAFLLHLAFVISCLVPTVSAEDRECKAFMSNRSNSEIVQAANSFDSASIFNNFPKFESNDSTSNIIGSLEKTDLEFGKIKVTCKSDQFLFFSIRTEDKNSLWTGLDGFYKLKGNRYFSGPFSSKELTVVIQSEMF
jgi:hypothetical protein